VKGIGATQATGRSEGVVGVTPTGIELGLKVGGIGELGISTDYGGGIVVAIFGQKIVWGREGGKIHYNFGLLEVLVEARDCVVTETRKIAGQVVASHIYPDPGCKLPPEPETPKPPVPNPNPNSPTRVEIPDLDVQGIVFLHVEVASYEVNGTFGSGVTIRKILSPLEEGLPTSVGRAPVKISSQTTRTAPTRQVFPEVVVEKNGVKLFVHQVVVYDPVAVRDSRGFFVNVEIARQNASSIYFTGDKQPLFFWGKLKDIRRFIEINDANVKDRIALYPTTYSIVKYIPFAFIPVSIKPLPSAGNQPPMPESCCESLKADIEDIKEVLATKEMLAKKIIIPGELLEIQTDGKPVPKPEIILNYGQMAHAILLAINRYGIDSPIKVEIEDTDTTKKGKQSDEFTYNSPAVALQAILELLWEIKGDSASRLKIQVRMAYAITRTLKIVAGVGESVRSIIKMLGLPFRYDKKKVPLEFNLASAKKGFGKEERRGRQGTSSTESELEALLPGLLQETEYDLPVPHFDADEDDDIRELLVKILIALETQPRK